MRVRLAPIAILIITICQSSNAIAAHDEFEEMRRVLHAVSSAQLAIDEDKSLGGGHFPDCLALSVEDLRTQKIVSASKKQYIHNAFYEWTEYLTSRGVCVQLTAPKNQLLSSDEARDLLTASSTEFPIDQRASVQGLEQANPTLAKTGPGTEPADYCCSFADSRVVLTSTSFPYNAVAFIQATNGTQTQSGAAVQVGPYSYMTAAHNLVNENTGVAYTNPYVVPEYHLPGVTNLKYLLAQAPVFPEYATLPANDDRKISDDIAFALAVVPHPLPRYPAIYQINDSVNPVWYVKPGDPNVAYNVFNSLYTECPQGDPSDDPYVLPNSNGSGVISLYNGLNRCADYDAAYAGEGWILSGTPHATTIVVGYPETVTCTAITCQSPTIDNTQAVLPYADYKALVYGQEIYPSTANLQVVYTNREMYIDCAFCVAKIGLMTWVSAANSGGPVFGQYGSDYVLLGIISSKVNNAQDNTGYLGAFAAGSVPKTSSFVSSYANWNPSSLIQISAPVDGQTYTANVVPNLTATAGMVTSQVSWSSNINGPLGMGTNVSVVNKLSPGPQILTASIGTTAQKSINVTISPSNATLSTPSNPIVLPQGTSSGNATISFNAPGYTQITLYGRQNQQYPGQILCLGSGAGSGTTVAPVAIGEAATVWLSPYTNCAAGSVLSAPPPGSLATLNFSVVAGAAPTVTANANPVIIPHGQSSAPYTLSWNAPGYSKVALYGQQNLAYSGQNICLGSGVAPSGSSVSSMQLSEIATITLTTDTGCTAGAPATETLTTLATLHLTAVQGAAPTLSGTPNPVTIPYGQSSAHYTLAWNAPGYTTLSIYGQQNLAYSGQTLCLGSVAGSGSSTQSMTPGEIANLTITADTGCPAGTAVTTLPTALATLQMTTRAGAAGTLRASPNPVTIPAGQSSASYTLSWTAPNYPRVALYGRQNLQYAGQILCLGSAAAPGSATEGMSVGEIADLWIVPDNNCTAGSAVSSVPPPILATVHITTD